MQYNSKQWQTRLRAGKELNKVKGQVRAIKDFEGILKTFGKDKFKLVQFLKDQFDNQAIYESLINNVDPVADEIFISQIEFSEKIKEEILQKYDKTRPRYIERTGKDGESPAVSGEDKV